MKLALQREPSTDVATEGALYVDGHFECFTLEDVIREVFGQPVETWKVDKKTAIPRGTYDVTIDESLRFGRPMPHILNVSGFTGIRIHSGNVAADTDGCVLLGQKETGNEILASRLAFDAFFPKLKAALDSGDSVTISITNPDDRWPNS